jgi:hypothetical protein
MPYKYFPRNSDKSDEYAKTKRPVPGEICLGRYLDAKHKGSYCGSEKPLAALSTQNNSIL